MNNEQLICIRKFKKNILVRIIIFFCTIGFGVNLILYHRNAVFRSELDYSGTIFFQYLLPIFFTCALILFINAFFCRKVCFEFSSEDLKISRCFKRTFVIPYSQISKIIIQNEHFMIDEYFKWESLRDEFNFMRNYALDLFSINRGVSIVFVFNDGNTKRIYGISSKYLREIKKIHELIHSKQKT